MHEWCVCSHTRLCSSVCVQSNRQSCLKSVLTDVVKVLNWAMNGCSHDREREIEPAAGVQWIAKDPWSGGDGSLCFKWFQECIVINNIYYIPYFLLYWCFLELLNDCVNMLHTSPSVDYPFWLTKKIGHILSHVCRATHSASGLILCWTLSVAHSNTWGKPRLSLLVCSRTSWCSAVLATAEEEDGEGRETQEEIAVKGEEKRLLFGSSIDVSQFLMEIDIFR